MDIQSFNPVVAASYAPAVKDSSQRPAAGNVGVPHGVSVLAQASNPSGQQNAENDPLQQAIKEVQDALSPMARDLQFSVDNETDSTVIKIVDTATNKVIKQIPSEEMLRISQALEKLQGLLVHQTA